MSARSTAQRGSRNRDVTTRGLRGRARDARAYVEPIRYKPAYTRQPLVKRIGGQPSLGDVALSTMSGFLLELPLLTEAGRFL